MRKKFIIPIIFMVLISCLVVPSQAVKTPILQVSTDEIYLTAGQENSIKIMIENTGDFSVFDIEILLISEVPGLSVLTNAQKVYNEIEEETTETFRPTLYVDQSLPLGSYTMTLTLLYRRFGEVQDSQVVIPISVVVDKGFTPKMIYSGKVSSGVTAGEEAQIEYSFKNNWGDTLYDINLVLNSVNPAIAILEGLIYSLDELPTGASFTINPIISIQQGTPLGSYVITATVSYNDEDNRFHQTFSLPLKVSSEKASESTILTIKEMNIEEPLQPGDIFNVELTVQCDGADSYDVMTTVSFDNSGSISPLSPTLVSLGDIMKGETETVTYQLLVKGDIKAGQYPMMFTATYTNSKGMPTSLVETLTIMVEGLIDFQLIDVPHLGVLRGGEAELEADLLLVGTESVEFVSIDVVEDAFIKRVKGSEEYIGAVDPDSPIPFDISFKIDDEAETGEHAVTLSVRYRDHLNKQHETSLEIPVEILEGEIESPTGGRNGGIWVWIRRLLGLN